MVGYRYYWIHQGIDTIELVSILLPSLIKSWITLHCTTMGTAVSVAAIVIFLVTIILNRLLQNFARVLWIHAVTCVCSFGATVSPHVENGWAMQNFLKYSHMKNVWVNFGKIVKKILKKYSIIVQLIYKIWQDKFWEQILCKW